MKNSIITTLLLLCAGLEAGAQNNYIQTNHYSDAAGRVAYSDKACYDGLGDLEQTIESGYTPLKKDLVTLCEYDLHKRQNKVWLPVPTLNADGRYVEPATLKTRSGVVYADADAYTETIYEPNTLGRVMTQYNAGAVFRTNDKSVHTTYDPNGANEVRIIDIDLRELNFKADRYYDACTLVKTGTVNEDGTQTYVYTDRAGRTVMTRVVNGTKNIDTYYGYDDLGRLTLVITPEGTANLPAKPIALKGDPFVDEYCYLYRYDSNGYPYEKLAPGGVREQLRYDSRGRLIRRYRQKRLPFRDCVAQYSDLYTYDAQNRLTEMWVVTLNVVTPLYDAEEYVEMPLTDSVDARPRVFFTQPVIKYRYDSYQGVPAELAFKPIGSNNSYVVRPAGLKTFEQVRLLENLLDIENAPDYLERAFYYDRENRLIERVERNHFGGVSYFSYTYDFQGRVVARTEHIQPDWNAGVDIYTVTNTYDHAGRLLGETSQLNSGPAVHTAYTYNELGQLTQKQSGPVTETYAYNTQGWLIGHQNNYFAADLRYYTPCHGASASYTGNITEWSWDRGSGAKHSYTFSYDSLSRFRNSNHYRNDTLINEHVEQGLTYDRNGNLLTLTRRSGAAAPEALVYTYSSGRLDSVSGRGYSYDRCGNIVFDGGHDLEISYNYINLPYEIRHSDRELVRYQYYADGTKFSALDADGTGLVYLGSLVYGLTKWNNPTLESAGFDSGRFLVARTSSGQSITPMYYVADHLGSTRAVVDAQGAVLEQRDYYPFGKPWPTAEAITSNRYLYNGKEQQWIADAGLLDYGARFYDPETGRWQTIDPLAEKYPSVAPYVYCMNNPIRHIDPDGAKIVDVNGNILYQNGQWAESAKGTDAMRLGNAMMKTKVGTEIFEQMSISSTLVTMSINSDIRRSPRGLVLGFINHKDNGTTRRADMIIYEGSLNEYIKPDKRSFDRKKQEMMRNSTEEDRLGAVSVHEGTHALDKIRDDEREERAVANEKAYLKEIERKRPIFDEKSKENLFLKITYIK